MRCAEARRRLFDPQARREEARAKGVAVAGDKRTALATDPQLRTHLTECARCSALAARLADVQAGLRHHRTEHVPDPAFAARVVARLPGTTEHLGWAALRLMPAALVLALVCSWYGATHGPGLSDLLLHPEDPQLLTYVALGGGEEGR